uniref:ABC transporter ATP-binding protein n=1 Tax=Bosea sp. NBC_00436 TaxID=2969620 RepID=A0A9E7ZS63_9HYPH
MADLIIEDLRRSFSGYEALKGISLEARKGEFLTLLGPSGCGKSTTLWLLAGLDRPTGGRITVGDRVMADAEHNLFVRAEQRDIGLVFQTYALWPHMSVRQNVAYPLKLRSVAKAERDRRVEEVLALVELAEQIDKYPYQLSGGQQQRVALARTLVFRPEILLLDEPLSNLDAKLRERARKWLRKLHDQLGITTVFVTHDQHEALALSDRIVVMRNGAIEQIDDPASLYRRPATPFVADFIGTTNFLAGTGLVFGDKKAVRLDDGTLVLLDTDCSLRPDERVALALRPESISIQSGDAVLPQGGSPGEKTIFQGRVTGATFLGARYEVDVACGDQVLRVETANLPASEAVSLSIPRGAWSVFPKSERD